MNVQKVTLNLNKRHSIPNKVVTLGQGDSGGTTIEATIMDGRTPATLTGMTANMCMKLPNGTSYFRGDDATVSGNTITYVVDEEHAAFFDGYTDEAYFEIASGSTKYSTERFRVHVLPDASENADPARSWTNGVDEALEAMEDAAQAAQDAVADIADAVEDAQTAVSNAQNAVSAANSAVSTAEGAITRVNTAIGNAETATSNANTAAGTANTAATNADTARNAAVTAAASANSAVTAVGNATTQMENRVNTAVTRANTAADNATYAANDAHDRIEAAIAAVGDISELAVPLMSADTRGGAKLGDGLAMDGDVLHVGALAKASTGEVYGPLASVSAKGWAEQDSTTGKNLWGNLTWRNAYIDAGNKVAASNPDRMAVISVSPNTEYTFKGTHVLTTSNSDDWIIGLFSTDPVIGAVGTRVLSSYSNTITKTFTTADDTAYLAVKVGSTTRVNISATNKTIQLELGSTATEYEPYTGGAPSPSPDYPQEIRVARGRNLIDESVYTNEGYYLVSDGSFVTGNNYAISDYVDVSGLTKITMCIDVVSSALSVCFYDSSKNYISGTTFNQKSYVILDVPANAKYIRTSISTVHAWHFWVVAGDEPLPYVPYGHVGLDKYGKNLFNKNAVTYGVYWKNGVSKVSNSNYCASDYIPVIPGKTYTVSGSRNSGNTPRMAFCNAEKDATVGIVEAGMTTYPMGNRTFQVPNGAAYFVMTIHKDDINKVQLEESDVATEYESYVVTTPIPLPSRSWVAGLPDGTADKLSVDPAGHVTWEEETAEVVFDGSESWTQSSSEKSVYIALDGVKIPTSNTVALAMLCNAFIPKSLNEVVDSGVVGIAVSQAGNIAFANGTSPMESSDFTTWLSTHPVTVLYPLATPITEDCGHINLPDIPSDATVSIRELEDLNLTFWVDADGTIHAASKAWYERAHSEYADRLTALENAVAEIVAGS